MKFIGYSKCSTCTTALKKLQKTYPTLTLHDYTKHPLTINELKEIHKISKLEIKKLFNTSGNVYKELNLKETFNQYSLEELYQLLSTQPMLIKRPIFITNETVYIGTQHCIYKDNEIK